SKVDPTANKRDIDTRAVAQIAKIDGIGVNADAKWKNRRVLWRIQTGLNIVALNADSTRQSLTRMIVISFASIVVVTKKCQKTVAQNSVNNTIEGMDFLAQTIH